MPNDDSAHLDRATKRFAEIIRGKAETLREAADDLDRRADRALTIGTDNFRGADFADNFAWIAGQVQHDVITVLFNLHIDGLTTEAHELDSLRHDIHG